MTPFCRAVAELIAARPNGVADGCYLRNALIDAGHGRHPAAVAMNLTKLAWKREYIDTFLDNRDCRMFVLTADGKAALEQA